MNPFNPADLKPLASKYIWWKTPDEAEEYTKSIEKWRQEVDGNLRRENGWLAFAGLFWLRKGTNLIGSAPDSDILLPSRAPSKLGTFVFDGDSVILNVELDTPLEVNGVPTKNCAPRY